MQNELKQTHNKELIFCARDKYHGVLVSSEFSLVSLRERGMKYERSLYLK